MFSPSLRRRVTLRAGVLAGTLAALAVALSACGQDRQDENEAEGTYSVRYRVAAGIDGKAIAESFDGSGAAKGSFIARVTRAPHPIDEN